MTNDKSMQKKPAQERSEDTVDVILQATAQVLDNPRDAPVTTNHIVQRADVSIGSLYRYVGDKQGILSVLVRREVVRQENRVNDLIENWSGYDGTDLIRQIAGISIDGFQGRRLVSRSLLKHLQEKDSFGRELHASRYRVLRLVEYKLTQYQPGFYRSLDDDERHAMLGAWAGAINAVITYSRHDFEVDALKNQFVDLVNGYLSKSD